MWWYAFAGLNIFALTLMGLDKMLAKGNKRRISERTLILVACFGGSLGLWSGMYLWRHKTRKIKFYLGVPVIVLTQITVLYFLFRRML